MSWYVAGMFIIGSVIAMLIATKLKKRLDDKILQTSFAIMLVVLGAVIYFIN